MKLWLLKKIAEELKNYKKILNIYRVEDSTIEIEFENGNLWFFELKGRDSLIYPLEKYISSKRYNAPFDVVLTKRFSNSKILNISIPENNRILKIDVEVRKSYKSLFSTIQLEFTGRFTNSIILDENGFVIEALRHISQNVSQREIKVGNQLLPLPNFEIVEKTPPQIENLKDFLRQQFSEREDKYLENLKKQKIKTFQKKMKKFDEVLNGLDSEELLFAKSKECKEKGDIILSHLHEIEIYQNPLVLDNFQGGTVTIEFPPSFRKINHIPNYFFNLSRRYRNRARNIHIERESIASNLRFLNRLISSIDNAKSSYELNILTPYKENKKEKKDRKSSNYEIFRVDGFKIFVGKNSSGNIELLKLARAKDFWFHLKDIPSTHVIVKTEKQSLPEHVLFEAGKLCAKFTTDNIGKYLVDYTQRRNVKVRERSNVNYTNYKTLTIEI